MTYQGKPLAAVVGDISPDGEYQIEQENGSSYLVNVNAAGLTHGSLEDDQAVDDTHLFSNPGDGTFVRPVRKRSRHGLREAGGKRRQAGRY